MPALEEAPWPAFVPIVSELIEEFLEKVGSVHALIGHEQGLEYFSASRAQVLLARQLRFTYDS